jgi:perosamine synthetase
MMTTLLEPGTRFIPISRPAISQTEVSAVVEVLRSGQLAQGEVVAAFEAAFAGYIGTRYAAATSSGTTALHLALLAHGIGPGDEVIVPPFSFVATANAIRYTGATPVFADVDSDTLNLSPRAVRASMTQRTRAIVAVHLYGAPCDMAELGAIAIERGLALIEDACQAHGAEFAGRRVGTFGTGCFSFYPTKNMTCGEGGMITTSDPRIAERIRLLRSHGMRVAYVHEELGYNHRMTDIHAAIGLAQLPRLDGFNSRRAANAAVYDRVLADSGACQPTVDHRARSAWHQYTLRIDPSRRDAVAARLRQRGIGVGIYYPIPIHQQPSYRDLANGVSCPVAEAASERVLSIPVYPGLTQDDVAYIASEVKHALVEV